MTALKLPRGRILRLDSPVVMGILNVTPDSFSDGGSYCQLDSAVKQAKTLLNQGAKIIDIGGESTRPGAPDVSLEDELERVIPLVKALRASSDCIISIDTSKSEVMLQAIIRGADIINDVRALQEPGAIEVLAQYPEVAICLMHMQGQPRTMQSNPHYDDLFADINEFFAERLAVCEQAGIQSERIILDPGFGFGKTLLFSKYSNDQREGHLIKYHDPNTGFYRSTLTLLAADNDDGHAYSGSLIKPFESLESTWSAGLNGYDVRQQRYLYDASVEYDRFGESDNFAEGFIGWRLGDVVDNSVTRLFVGASFRNQFYYPLGITQYDTSVPEHQHGTTYWAELQWLKHDYKEMVNLEAMNRIEDINFGLVSNFRLGFYKAQTGSVDTGVRAQGGLSKYFQLSDNQFIQASLSSTGLFDGGTLYDAATAGRIAYFHKQKIAGESAQFFAEYKEASLVRPFGHHYLELGPTQGARGYEARYQTGEHRQVITLEERWYGQHEWFSLFYLGAALFYDAAHVWGDSPVDLSQEGWLHSAGFGFRIMTNRLGGREGGGVSVLHIDFAGPVGPDRPVDSGQVLVTVKQGF